VLATLDHFRVPAQICINKHDLNPSRTGEIERFCSTRGIEVVGRIPFDSAVTEAMVQGRSVTECVDGFVSDRFLGIWERIAARLSGDEVGSGGRAKEGA
jgi:MinD superfamily P-loop ATPase